MSVDERKDSPQTFFIPGSRGALHVCYFRHHGPAHPEGDVLFVPPFGEEMNRCRAMVALQARALADIGMATIVVDPFGTGDSAGDFVDATWDQWRGDLQTALDWMRGRGRTCRTLWGLRLGAAMASEMAKTVPGITRLLLWQPVIDGKQHFTQFLRIRIAAEMNLPDRVKSVGELRQRSAAGESIEVSGYRLGPRLALHLDSVKLEADALAAPVQTTWFEVLPNPEAALPVNTQAMVDRLRASGAPVTVSTAVGPSFWHVHERELAPDLVQATTEALRRWAPTGPTDPAPPELASEVDQGLPEHSLTFDCEGDRLVGIVHDGSPEATRGVIIVVAGGPQYRAGAHRQFVTLARRLASDGHAVLRFDLRGMGDSSGDHRGYKQSDADIRAAIDALMSRQPKLRDVVLLGECESASGILFYAWRDPRVRAAVLINPWVRTEEGRAQTIVRHYYLGRLTSADFWKQVLSGQFEAGKSLHSLVDNLRAYLRGRIEMRRQSAKPELDDLSGLQLPVRVAEGLRRFQGSSLLLMSGFDLIAREFDEVTSASKAWEGLLQRDRLQRVDIEGADHTFSRELWKTAAAGAVADWMRRL